MLTGCAGRRLPAAMCLFWQRSRCASDRQDKYPLCTPAPSAALLAAIAGATAGCQTTQTHRNDRLAADRTPPVDRPDADWRRDVQVYGEKYRANPAKTDVAIQYAQALRATGQRAQAVAVLEHARSKIRTTRPCSARTAARWRRPEITIRPSKYSTALIRPTSPIGTSCRRKAPCLIKWAATPTRNDYYLTALKIVPEEPSVLSNLGLSYALSKDLARTRKRLYAAPQRNSRSIRGYGKISLSWSASKVASRKQKQSLAPTFRRKRPPPTSLTCGRCSRTAKTCAIRRAERADRAEQFATLRTYYRLLQTPLPGLPPGRE